MIEMDIIVSFTGKIVFFIQHEILGGPVEFSYKGRLPERARFHLANAAVAEKAGVGVDEQFHVIDTVPV